MADDRMPKLDLQKDFPKLSTSDLHWIKSIEQDNLERVQKLQKTRKGNLITAGVLALGVFSIYGYTLKAIKQEQYFDDFEVPATIKKE